MDEKLIGNKRKRILVGGILIVLGFVLVACALLIGAPGGYMWNFSPFYSFTSSFLIISIGLWYLMTNIKQIAAYFLMGMICVLSPLMFVYASQLLGIVNCVLIDSLICSLLLGAMGIFIGAVGILQEGKKSLKAKLTAMIVLWFFAMLFGLLAVLGGVMTT